MGANMNPTPFDIARETSKNFSNSFKRVQDENVIDNILKNVASQNDPRLFNDAIGQILSKVSPDRQPQALKFIESRLASIKENEKEEKQRDAAKSAGYTFGAPPQVQAQQVKDKNKTDRLKQFPFLNAQGASPTPGTSQPSLDDLSDEQLILLSGSQDREVAEPANQVLKRRLEDRKEGRQDSRDRRKETQKVREDIANKAAVARQSINEKQRLIELIDTGKINDPTYATILTQIPMRLGERFLSPETTEYKAGLVAGYRDLRNIFQGQTRVKEIELLEDKIADIYLTDEQKKAILKSSLQTLQYDLIKAEAASEVENKFPNLGVLEFSKKVDEQSQPQLKSLANRIIDEQKSFIKDAENRKKIPLDYDDPEGRQILEQIMKEANGNRQKAREIAKKKGYIIGK